MNIPSNVEAVLRRLENLDQIEREQGLPSAQRMRSIPRDVGRFLKLLAGVAKARSLLEIGTSAGYSTIWLGLVAQAHGGHLVTLEKDSERAQRAREHVREAGLAPFVTVENQLAESYLADLAPSQIFEFVFLDAEKADYLHQFELVFPHVRPEGLIVADNVLSHPEDLADYVQYVTNHAHLETVIVPIGRGEAVSLKVAQRLALTVRSLLQELEAYAREHPGMWNIPPAAGHFLHILVRAMRARRVLEVGTSNGYSGIWLATALQQTDGQLVTVERDSAKINLARRNFRRAGVADRVEIRMGDAGRVLPALKGSFDLVFFDAEKSTQLEHLKILLQRRRIRPGGLIVSDNAITHPQVLAPYHSYVRTHPQLDSLTVPIGNGFEISQLKGG